MASSSKRRGTNRINRSDANSRWNSLVDRNPAIVKNKLRMHELSPLEAIELLERSDSYGCESAGRLCVELAHKTTDVVAAADLLTRARENFERATGVQPKGGIISDHHARALLRLAQLPNDAYVVGTGKLPPAKIAVPAYEDTLEASLKIADSYDRAVRSHIKKASVDLAGIAVEASFLTLGQRYAIWSGIDPETWFPMLSHYSEDNRNGRSGTVHDRSWDYTIFEQQDDAPIKAAYLLQLKSSPEAKTFADPLPESGITTVCLRPELQLNPSEKLWMSTIIHECANENGSRQAHDNLERRTELFLDAIDKPHPALVTG